MNKKITLAVCSAMALFIGPEISAQNIVPCGTEPTLEQIEFLNQTRKERQLFNATDNKSITDIPVQHHIARRSDGTGGLSPSVVTTLMNDLNTYYAGANLSFSSCNDINYIDNDTYYDFSTSEENTVCGIYDVPNVINVYYFNTVTSGTSSYCGYTRLPPSTLDRIIVKNSCATNGSTVVHEFGHYFSLYHSHGKTNNGTTDELVNGSNCASAGDDVCDTPADPNLSGKVNSSCQYTGTQTDANGEAYQPNPRNIMSYSLKQCRDFLSTGQMNRVAFSAVNDRSYLFCDSTPPPPPAPCFTTISNFPYKESFESGFGFWSNPGGDDMNWTRDTYSTSSGGTGPSAASDGYYYAYTEASSPNYPSKKAFLESPCFDLSSLSNPELSFFYNMYGTAMGTLQVDISTDAGATWNNAIWFKSGNQGTNWHFARISLSGYSGNEVRIRIHGTTGTSFTSDMAIDDIQVSEYRLCPRPVVSFPYHETFYSNNTSDWTQSTNDDIDWTVNHHHTPSAGTGPASAADGYYYIYVESSLQYFKKAIIESPCYDLSNTSSPELSFQFHMYGNEMGSLAVQASSDGGQTWSGNIWYISGNQGLDDPNITRIKILEQIIDPSVIDPNITLNLELKPWIQANVPLGDFASENTMIRFVAVTGSGSTSDIAVDDIHVQSTPCTKTVEAYPYNESFELGLGDWTQESNDDIDWTENSGPTATPGTGPDAASHGLRYVYVEASGTNSPEKKAGLISPCFNLFPDYPYSEQITIRPIADLYINFKYHMFGSDVGSLKMQISRDNGNTWEDKIIRNNASYSNEWQGGFIYLYSYGYSTIRVRFLAETGNGSFGDIAIDNFNISVTTSTIVIQTDGVESDKIVNQSQNAFNSLKIYPNPSKARNITLGNPEGEIPSGNILIYDALGQLVWEKQINNEHGITSIPLDLNTLKGGYYFARIISKDGNSSNPIKFVLID